MNTEITIIASIFLLLGGLAAFPFTLDYSNTSWMPRWMRPDIDYLERPFRYDYPGTDRAKRICSQIQKGRGIFADSRPYYVVVSRRRHEYTAEAPLMLAGKRYELALEYDRMQPYMYITATDINPWGEGWITSDDIFNPRI